MKIKIVFDTSVLISAFIATGACKDIFEYAFENHEIIISPYILEEMRKILTEKLGFSQKDFKEIKKLLTAHLKVTRERKTIKISFPDKKDIPILQLCLTVNAHILLTGDKKLRNLVRVGKTKIILPSEFWDFERSLLCSAKSQK